MSELRLGDEVDDHCTKCKRITNHAIVSLVNGEPAKVRCRTCYNDHDFRRGEAPPSKKDLKKAQLFQEVLAAGAGPSTEPVAATEPAEAPAPPPEPEPEPKPVPARKTRAKKS
jgi:hypothetical protein